MFAYCVTQSIPDIDFVSAMVVCPDDVVDFVLSVGFTPFQMLGELALKEPYVAQEESQA